MLLINCFKNSNFLFTQCSLSLGVSLTIFFCSLYFSLLFCLLSLTQFSKTALSSISLTRTSLHSSLLLHQMAEWPFLLFLHLFLLFFLPNSSHQVTINASTEALTFVHDIRQKRMNSILFFTWPNVLVFSLANFSSSFNVSHMLNVKSH